MHIRDQTVQWLAQTYTEEGGVRRLKQLLYRILREVNLRIKKGKLELPVTLSQKTIRTDYLKKVRPIEFDKVPTVNGVGKINGLYATSNDTGGIMNIECSMTPHEKTMALALTGQQGHVMKESMQVARTLAWNELDVELRQPLSEKYLDQGFLIHCPEGATP